MSDERFSRVRFEKKYVGAPKKSQKKLEVDPRFQSMFDAKKFKPNCDTDSRGHPLSITKNADINLKEFYKYEPEHESQDESDEETDEVPKLVSEGKDGETSDEGPDFARGQGNLESSSSDESSSDDENEEEIIHAWAELDANVPEAKDITNRLAVCNMNWDRMSAQDLMVVLNSFKNPEGCIRSVKVYKSEYGKERLREEELKGPQELAGGEATTVENDQDDVKDDSEGEEFNEKIRQYQLSRLKYFYAVVECDTPETANKIYEECDGLEYESSACRFDMRFIPDDMTFDDEEPTSVAEATVDTVSYKPKYFTTDALNLGKVSLTWDETDPERAQVLKQALESGEMEEMDLKVYLASSDEDGAYMGSDEEHGEDEDNQIAKYRALLQSIDEDKKKEDDTGMEMTWGTDLELKTEELVKKKVVDKELTPWEKYLEKKRGKVIEKRMKKTKDSIEDEKVVVRDTGKNNESDIMCSDDELPPDVDMNDPYFKLSDDDLVEPKEKRKRKLRKKKAVETEEDKIKKAELELLLMDDEDDDKKHHFNLKDILLAENPKKKKRKMKKLKESEKAAQDDGFTVKVDDPRFEALYSSHLYNIDPSEPSYTKTKAMQAILEEKRRRRSEGPAARYGESNTVEKSEGDVPKPQTSNLELSMLVKSVKSKSQSFKNKARQK